MIRQFLAIGAVCFLLATGATAAERLMVNADMANIRSGPGTQYEILWKVEKYHPIEVIKKKGEWYYFQDYEGDKGWMFEKLVSREPAIIIKKDMCNVRSGPGTTFSIQFNVEKGVPFKVLERKGEWIHVQHTDGEKGWVHDTLVW